jgi:hypothetical protein
VPIPRATTRALIDLSRPNNALPRTSTPYPEASRTLWTTPARNPGDGFNSGCFFRLAAAVQDLPEDRQERRRIGPVVVDPHQRRRGPGGRGQVAWPDPQVDHEPADDRQGRVNPDPAVQLIELDHLGRLVELVDLERVEVLDATAGLFEDAIHGAWVDVADLGGGLSRVGSSGLRRPSPTPDCCPRRANQPSSPRLANLNVVWEMTIALGRYGAIRRTPSGDR